MNDETLTVVRGIEIDNKDGNTLFTYRSYIVKNRSYILGVANTKEHFYNKSMYKFFNSFNLK